MIVKVRSAILNWVMNISILSALLLLSACGEMAKQPISVGIGSRPLLLSPNPTLIPTMHIAPAIGWPNLATPVAVGGTRVTAFANGLEHPRWLYVLPNGDVLVAETNAPPKPDDGNGIQGWIMGLVMKRAGAAVPSANRITLLRDINGDGVADIRLPFLEDLHSPFGMVLVGDKFYVANSDAVMRYNYTDGEKQIMEPGARRSNSSRTCAATLRARWPWSRSPSSRASAPRCWTKTRTDCPRCTWVRAFRGRGCTRPAARLPGGC